MIDIKKAGEVRVVLETPDGMVWSGTATIAEIERSIEPVEFAMWNNALPIRTVDRQTWPIQLNGVGELTASAEFTQRIWHNRAAAEWRCDFCGAVHPRKSRQCSQCGAWRSFLCEV